MAVKGLKMPSQLHAKPGSDDFIYIRLPDILYSDWPNLSHTNTQTVSRMNGLVGSTGLYKLSVIKLKTRRQGKGDQSSIPVPRHR